MADELIDIVDEQNNLTGVQKMKSEAHRDGLWHRTAHIWIYNSKGEMLLQLRAKDKNMYPDLWDIAAGGHVGAGENILISALRELEEEIGITAKETDLELLSINKVQDKYKNIQDNEFNNVYLLKFDGSIDALNLQKEEVQEIKFIDIDALKKNLQENYKNYVPRGEYWFEIIETVRGRT